MARTCRYVGNARVSFHLGPKPLVWYLARYRDIKISDAGVYLTLKHIGVNCLPRGTTLGKVSTTRYQKRVRGHHIRVDVKPLTFKEKDDKLQMMAGRPRQPAGN